MAQDPEATEVALDGNIYKAAVGTDPPAGTGDAWTGWTDVGYADVDDPFSIEPSFEKSEKTVWPGKKVVRSDLTRAWELKVKLVQATGTNLKLAFGGGTVEDLGGGDYMYHPPSAAENDEFALGWEIRDGDKIHRYIFYRCTLADSGAIAFNGDDLTTFDLTFTVLEPETGDAWNKISNDPAMAD